ncbi:TPA: DedA family protein [Candidatus Woesearchaeota archaeon]|nr:DedA family protein [Candidatus Woesearchaeota archaeon]
MLDFAIEWVVNIILFLGYPGIAILMVLESMIFPLPSEAVLPFAGYLVSEGSLNIWLVVLAATIGSVIGSWIGYEMGRFGGRPFLRRYGKYFLLNETHLDWTERWFRKYGEKTIFLSRLIPVVRHFISIPAGASGMNKPRFFFYTFTGAFAWNLFLTWCGVLMGQNWQQIARLSKPFEVIIMIVIVGLAAWFVFKEIEKRTLRRRAKKQAMRTQ